MKLSKKTLDKFDLIIDQKQYEKAKKAKNELDTYKDQVLQDLLAGKMPSPEFVKAYDNYFKAIRKI